MIIKCKECGTSIEIDESQYQEGIDSTTLCPLCGENVRFSIISKEQEILSTKEGEPTASFCPYCGTKMAKEHRFCPNCGHSFDMEVPPKKNYIESDNNNSKKTPSQSEDVKAQTTHTKRDVERKTQPKLESKVSKSNSGKGCLLGFIILLLVLLITGLFIGFYVMFNSSLQNKEESSITIRSLEGANKGDMEYKTNTSSPHEEYTDLGLSVLWSNHNIGASNEMDYGELYGWGNTQTELSLDLDQYPCANPPYSIIGTKYDVAQAILGDNWRMPTLAELRELKESCSWNLVDYSQGRFYKVTGPNGNSILLPLAGYRRGNEYKSVGEWGFIWSSELYEGNSQFAANLAFGGKKGTVETSGYYRYGGESIRPVMDKR